MGRPTASEQNREVVLSVLRALWTSETVVRKCAEALAVTPTNDAPALTDLSRHAEAVIGELNVYAAFRFGRGWRNNDERVVDGDGPHAHGLRLAVIGGLGLYRLLIELAAVTGDDLLAAQVGRWRTARAALSSRLERVARTG